MEIKDRLKETSENCLQSYESWMGDKANNKARESLLESVHELRKVASRLEIEIAISERDELNQQPIPVPPHRNAKARVADENGNGNHFEDEGQRKPPSRKRQPRKSAGGGRASS